VLSDVGLVVFVPVVVRVDVLEGVVERDGTTAGLSAVPVNNRPSIIHRRRRPIRPYNIGGDYY
jgi:hypothetical protein